MNPALNISVESIWNQYSKHLFSFIKKRVANEQDAEDILQTVFLKIISNFGSLHDSNKIESWVFSVTRNAIIDFYRSQKLQRLSNELSEDIPDESKEMQPPTANEEIANCLKAMVMNLPTKYKDAILMTQFRNLTQTEFGKSNGLSIPGAKSRVQRARGMLKKMLNNCCQLEFDRVGHVVDYKHKRSGCKFC